jgi:hypothetical protein
MYECPAAHHSGLNSLPRAQDVETNTTSALHFGFAYAYAYPVFKGPSHTYS